jgi:hypothetical protein
MMGELLSSGTALVLDASSTRILLLPCALAVYYLLAWLRVGRGPKAEPIVAQYAAPANMSPAEARYLYTRKSDHKTVAAVLSHLASQKIMTIQPETNGYRVTRLLNEMPANLPEEEAAAFRAILEVETFKNPADKNHALHPKSFLICPDRNDNKISLIGSVISGSLTKRVQDKYFNHNLRYSAPAITLSVAGILVAASTFQTPGVVFLTLWFTLCGLMLSLFFVMSIGPAIRDILRGRMSMQRILLFVGPLLFCVALGFVGSQISKKASPTFLVSLIFVLVLNSCFAVILSKMTPLGRKSLDELLGFREFLANVELDQFNRLNNPHFTPTLLNDSLAYAIALDLKDAWGDHLSNALFATATTSID